VSGAPDKTRIVSVTGLGSVSFQGRAADMIVANAEDGDGPCVVVELMPGGSFKLRPSLAQALAERLQEFVEDARERKWEATMAMRDVTIDVKNGGAK